MWSQDEAEQLATFAQKYEVTLMSKASDDYLLITSYSVPQNALSHYSCYSGSETKTEVNKQLPDILKWAMVAKAKGVPKTYK
ncbi:hypothetical protein ABBQ32_000178 [Trebouxia sp. C0010 RCD-2024]